MKNKLGILTLILGILLIVVTFYLIEEKYSQNRLEHETEVFMNGSMYGQKLFYNQIMNELTQCKKVPLPFNNQTVNLVLIECLK